MRRIPRDEWINLANYHVWRILKVLEDGGAHSTKEIIGGSSPTITIKYLRLLAGWGLVRYRERQVWPYRKLYTITKLGRALLECYDRIGEIVKVIKGEDILEAIWEPAVQGCPVCNEIFLKNETERVYECPRCGCIFKDGGKILLKPVQEPPRGETHGDQG
jgi:DNA-binding HxlR family transcriptional regulator/DNA-directed RNA polymerase subunit RPC12/RpoP